MEQVREREMGKQKKENRRRVAKQSRQENKEKGQNVQRKKRMKQEVNWQSGNRERVMMRKDEKQKTGEKKQWNMNHHT